MVQLRLQLDINFLLQLPGTSLLLQFPEVLVGCLLFTLENALLGWDSVLDNVLFVWASHEPSYVLPGHFCVKEDDQHVQENSFNTGR